MLAPIYNFIFKPKRPRRFIELIESLKLAENAKFLEIGGGNGRLTQYFVPYFAETWLLDPSIPMLKEARHNHPQIHPVYGYANDLPFPDASFDFIFIYDSFHHWEDRDTSLREIRRILKPTGHFIISEIHPYHKSGHFIVRMEKTLKMGSHFYDPFELKNIIRETGFNIKTMKWLRKPTYYIHAV